MNKYSAKSMQVITKPFLMPFILVGLLFPLWGFANDITNPLVAAFKNILLISHFESALVQFAFYGGYCLMAIPAAIFIKRFKFKRNKKHKIKETNKFYGSIYIEKYIFRNKKIYYM